MVGRDIFLCIFRFLNFGTKKNFSKKTINFSLPKKSFEKGSTVIFQMSHVFCCCYYKSISWLTNRYKYTLEMMMRMLNGEIHSLDFHPFAIEFLTLE